MTHIIQRQSGMSLVEATIILMVLALLTSALAPSISDYVNDARQVRVKQDCAVIGTSIARLTRDVGRCLKASAAAGCTKSNRVDILYSDGPDVVAEDLTGNAVPFSSADVQDSLNWDKDDTRGDSMQRQFVTNGPRYGTPATLGTYSIPGPQFGLGWRGGYIEDPVGADPWGNRYLVNTAFLMVALDASAGHGEGNRGGGWSQDVFCLSAGSNELFETPFGGQGFGGTLRGGDDTIFIVAGDSR